MLRAMIHGIFVRYCGPAASEVIEGDADRTTLRLRVAMSDGGEEQRFVDCDRGVIQQLEAKLQYPFGAIKDNAARKQACQSWWSSMCAKFATIGTVSVTTLLTSSLNMHAVNDAIPIV